MTVRDALSTSLASLTTPPTTQASTAINAIKDFILRSHLRPGDPLPTESQLCADLGMSRSSIREAVRTLVALDIVEVRHGHGTFVGQASMRPMVESLVFRGLLNPGDDYRGLRDLVQVRAKLDAALAEEVTEAWKGRQDPALDDTVTRMEELAERGELFLDEDRDFHSRLLAPVPNLLFQHLTEAFWSAHTLIVPLLGVPTPKNITDTANAHRAILEAARAGDVQAYRQATVEHYAPLLAVLERS